MSETATPEVKPAEAKPKFEITEEERENFFKAFLSDEPYTETRKLFNGRLKITFKTLNIDENDEVFKQIRYDQSKGIAANDDNYFVKIIEYRLAGSVVDINDEVFCPEITLESLKAEKEEGSPYILARLKVMQKWNTFKLGAITEAFNNFEEKVRALTEDSVKGNF